MAMVALVSEGGRTMSCELAAFAVSEIQSFE